MSDAPLQEKKISGADFRTYNAVFPGGQI